MKRQHVLITIILLLVRVEALCINVRSIGMGEAFTAIADDTNAVFYNPAGIAFQERGAVDVGNMLDDTYSYLLGGFIIPSARLGFGYTDFSYPGLYRRNTIHTSLGIKMSETFAIGISGKNLSIDFDDAFPLEIEDITNADVGLLVKTGGFSLGLLMADLLETSSSGFSGPSITSLANTRAGICLGGKEFKFAVDYWAYSDEMFDINGICIGMEYMMETGIGLRIGRSGYSFSGIDIYTVNMGISIVTSPLVIHYANVTPYMSGEMYPDLSDHYISFGIRFGSKKKEETPLMRQYPQFYPEGNLFPEGKIPAYYQNQQFRNK